ncbi:hypothetical protein BKA70DRAFT_1562605 [Coprinopsis sp. MPI-PUGE-AT-0042]|nr:hypothetical protein BKA70DRAFT_1562605 [Coprinopsis sp. MPI-PUGE-AT-0042]
MVDCPLQPQQPTSSARARARDTMHYHTVAVFLVEEKLYSIPTSFLKQQSEAFAGMFSLDNCSEGLSDDSPIFLEGYKSADFDSLLKVLIPRPLATSLPNLSKEEWISTLKLATVWQMEEIRTVSISKLSEMNIPAIEKVTLAREYHVASWFREGIEALADDAHAVKIEELAALLGWETTARIFAIRDSANKPKAGANEPTLRVSQLACIGCGASSLSPGVPYTSCCSGTSVATRYGSRYVQGYSLISGPDSSLAVSPRQTIRGSVLKLFGEELKVLEQH